MADHPVRGVLALVVALWFAPGIAAQPVDDSHQPSLAEQGVWSRVPLRVWGFDDALRHYDTEAVFSRPIEVPHGHRLRDARLVLRLAEGQPIEDRVRGLEISGGWNVLEYLSGEDFLRGPQVVEVPFGAEALETEASFTLAWLLYDEPDPCQGRVPLGTWGMIEDGYLELLLEPQDIPSDLEIFPRPFFDPRTEPEPTVRLHLLTDAPTPALLEAAGRVAGILGALQGGPGVRVEASWGTGDLPAGHAVVMGATDRIESLLGVTIGTGPSFRIVDHPGPGSAGHKLLVVQGADEDGVGLAAARLGQLFPEHDPGAPPVPSLGGAVFDPRTGESTPLLPTSIHEGTGGGTLSHGFTVAPGSLSGDVTGLEWDLEVTQRQPLPFLPTRLDVELNGRHLTTLEPPDDCLPRRHTLVLPRHRLQRFNRLSFHVAATQVPPLCGSWDYGREVRTTLILASGPRLVTGDGPDVTGVEAFALTASPLSADPTGRRTAIVLPPAPLPAEVGSALSLVSYLGAVVGTPPGEVVFTTTDALLAHGGGGDLASRDLLIVGERDRLSSWGALSDALATGAEMADLNQLATTYGPDAGPGSAIVQSLPSPLDESRTAILVTAVSAASLPGGADLRAYPAIREGDSPGILVLFRGHASYLDPDWPLRQSADGTAAEETAASCRTSPPGPLGGAVGTAILALLVLLGLCLRFSREDS